MMPTNEFWIAFYSKVGDFFAIVAIGVFFDWFSYIVPIFAGFLSIALKIPRIKADVYKYHDGSWMAWAANLFSFKRRK